MGSQETSLPHGPTKGDHILSIANLGHIALMMGPIGANMLLDEGDKAGPERPLLICPFQIHVIPPDTNRSSQPTHLTTLRCMATETALEPELVICDAHHHLWDNFELFGNLERAYLTDDFRRDLEAGHRVEQTVYIEVRSHYRESGPEELRPVGETEWVVSLDTSGGIAAGIVGFADLRLGDAVEPVLAAHIDAGAGRFRGVRHASAWDASPDIRNSGSNPTERMLEQPGFRRGVATLGRMGLSFDAWLFHPQIPEFTALARSQPEVTMVLDHLGGPIGIGPYAGHRDEVLANTRQALTELVPCENAVIKLGGIGMTILGLKWHKRGRLASSAELVDAWGPIVRWCIETFGPQRCMFESNFPVDSHSADYVTLWNAFKLMTQDLSASERALLFHDTAARVYRLSSSRETTNA